MARSPNLFQQESCSHKALPYCTVRREAGSRRIIDQRYISDSRHTRDAPDHPFGKVVF